MGLLDDAIREHLELKRGRGADPGEVAREENDALGPVQREAGPDPGLASPDPGLGDLDPDLASLDPDSADLDPGLASPDPDLQGEAGVGQETAEIDMHKELHDGSPDPGAAQAFSEGRSAPVGHPAHTRVPDEESLEWEVPTESAGDPAGEPPPPADAESGAGLAGEDAEERPEDVLEETPDFLRDTPEQERLWFEQRPPRDFDFNE